MSGGKVRFELTSGAETREASETVSDALVVSPTLVGYIIEHLRALRSGATLPVRLAVLERLETIGFDLELVDAPQGRTRVRMKASSPFIRMAIDPITFTFETASSKLLVLEGRVPPQGARGPSAPEPRRARGLHVHRPGLPVVGRQKRYTTTARPCSSIPFEGKGGSA